MGSPLFRPWHLFPGEKKEMNAFLATRDGDEVEELAGDFPRRWHVKEFCNTQHAPN